jgi:hypothetical protein
MNTGITLSILTEPFGKPYVLIVPLPEHQLRELCEPLETSNDMFSINLAGGPRFVRHRQEVLAQRQELSHRIASEVQKTLMHLLAINDKKDGYDQDQLRPCGRTL